MFLRERQDKIVSLVNAEGRVTVTALAERFDVTEDCIRKDLRQLEAAGALRKVYGGAVSVSSCGAPLASTKQGTRRKSTARAFEKVCRG